MRLFPAQAIEAELSAAVLMAAAHASCFALKSHPARKGICAYNSIISRDGWTAIGTTACLELSALA